MPARLRRVPMTTLQRLHADALSFLQLRNPNRRRLGDLRGLRLPGRFRIGGPSGVFFNPLRGGGNLCQLHVSPWFGSLPKSIYTTTKFSAGFNLLASHGGLFGREKTRAGLAAHGLSEAVVGSMPCLGILRTSATWLAALDRTFRKRASAHGFAIGQLGCKLTNPGWDSRRKSGHVLILRHYTP
jgi:hypothetical protein